MPTALTSEDAHSVHANPDRLTVVADEVAKFGCVDLGSRRKGPGLYVRVRPPRGNVLDGGLPGAKPVPARFVRLSSDAQVARN
jgi:hypothetical protein